MFSKKRNIYLSGLVVLFCLIVYFCTPRVYYYFVWRQVAEAAGGMPWQDAGKIVAVREPCILDSPPNAPTTCAISCPQVTAVYGPACVNFIEIDVISQKGATFIAAPIIFEYKGGGTHPMPGTQYIAGGSSPAQPWVIGIPPESSIKASPADTDRSIRG